MGEITITADAFGNLSIRMQDGDNPPHRRVIAPGQIVNGVWTPTDLTGEPAEVQVAASEHWTPEVLAAAQARAEAAYVPFTPSDADVNAERDRRITAGFPFMGKTIQFDSDSQANILGACQMAALGILPADFQWITADNSILTLTAQEVIQMGAVGAAHKQAMIFAARALKDMAPIPANYASDEWWA